MDFDISDKLETICLIFQSLFPGKNKKNIVKLLSAEFAQWVVMVKVHCSSRNWQGFE